MVEVNGIFTFLLISAIAALSKVLEIRLTLSHEDQCNASWEMNKYDSKCLMMLQWWRIF